MAQGAIHVSYLTGGINVRFCISLGLASTPASPEYALLRWTDTSQDALQQVRFIGFTAGARQQSVSYGAVCVVFDYSTIPGAAASSPYSPYPPYQYQSPGLPQPNFRTGLEELSGGGEAAPAPATTTAAPLPWDIFSLLPSPGPASVTRRRVVAAPGQQKVIEPVLKNQYLTKLQRTLLPPPSHLVSDFDAENII